MSETLSQARLRQCSQNTQGRSRSRMLYRSVLTGCKEILTRCGRKSNISECSNCRGKMARLTIYRAFLEANLKCRNIWREGCTTYISIRCTRNSHRVRCGAFQTQLLRPSKNWIQFRNLRRLPGAISAGFSGQAIIPALLAGERDLKALAKLRDPRGQASEQEIVRVSRRGKTISASL
jgi:hypothetical protein